MSLYRIRAVADMCGITTATLRAWERRYGVPSPARTASSYRLYGDADIAVIKAMCELVNNGTSAAEAARAVLAARPAKAPEEAPELDPFEAARDRIVEATVRIDPDGIQLELNRALGLGSATTIYDSVLGPALRRIGELWHEGAITVGQEHLASQYVLGTLVDLLRLAQPSDSSRRVALACFADEDHVFGLYGVALRFTSWGYRTLMIGARTPPVAIARIVESLAPDAVALSAVVAPAPPRARELVDAYADACRETPWIVGGDAAEAMRGWVEARGGLIAGPELSELRRTLDRTTADRRRKSAREHRGER